MSLLLSGSVDGLLNLFDLRKDNEEEALESSYFYLKNYYTIILIIILCNLIFAKW